MPKVNIANKNDASGASGSEVKTPIAMEPLQKEGIRGCPQKCDSVI